MDTRPTLEADLAMYAQQSMQRGDPAIAVSHPLIGHIGHLTHEHGFTLALGMSSRAYRALLRDEAHFREHPTHARWTRIKKLAHAVQVGELGSVATWGDIASGRLAGKADDFLGWKTTLATTNTSWMSLFTCVGCPGAGSYTSLPGAVMTHTMDGAWPLSPPVPDTAKKYLLNVCTTGGTTSALSHLLVVDLLVAAGGISATSTGTQTINVAPTRYTDGRGVQMVLEVTTQLGASAANVTITYDDVIGTGKTTPSAAMTASAVVGRLQPDQYTNRVYLAAGAKGVKKIVSLALSSSMGAGALAALQYKPLILMPYLTTYVYNELNVASSMLNFQELVYDSTNDKLGYITFLGYYATAATATTIQILMQTGCG